MHLVALGHVFNRSMQDEGEMEGCYRKIPLQSLESVFHICTSEGLALKCKIKVKTVRGTCSEQKAHLIIKIKEVT